MAFRKRQHGCKAKLVELAPGEQGALAARGCCHPRGGTVRAGAHVPPAQVPPVATSTTAWSPALQPRGWLAVPPSDPPREMPHACSQEQARQLKLAHGPSAQAAIRLPPANPPARQNPVFVLARSTARALGTPNPELISRKLPHRGWGTMGGFPFPRAALVPQRHRGQEDTPLVTPCRFWKAVPGMNPTDHYLSACSLLSGLF